MPIRIDCYLSVMKKFAAMTDHKDAHFENVTREYAESPLSPSRNLLYGFKRGEMTQEQFFSYLLAEFKANPDAIDRIAYLRDLSKRKVVFLVCVEKDPAKCHRSFLKKLIEGNVI